MKQTQTIETVPHLPKSMQKERRRSLRVTPDPLLTICLPSGNRGVVLDVSDDGLGFLASSAVDDAETIRFEISARSTRGPEARGDLVWKDSTGKRGGLRFTDVPEDLRELLRNFLPPQRSVKRALAPAMSPAIVSKGERETERRILGSDDIPDLPQFDTTMRRTSPVNYIKWTFLADTLTVVLACVIAAAIWYSIDHSMNRRDVLNLYSQVKRSFSTFISTQRERLQHGWTIPAKSGGERASARPAPPQVPFSSSQDLHLPVQAALSITKEAVRTQITSTPAALATAPGPKTDVTAKASEDHVTAQTSSDATVAHAPGQTHAPSELNDSSQTQVALARKLLQEDASPSDQPKAVQLLWQAVAKGNTAAELELADLYLAGHGVSKSCSQAFVLLTAAKTHKNTQAEQALRSLPQYGCGSTGEPQTSSSSEPAESTQ